MQLLFQPEAEAQLTTTLRLGPGDYEFGAPASLCSKINA